MELNPCKNGTIVLTNMNQAEQLFQYRFHIEGKQKLSFSFTYGRFGMLNPVSENAVIYLVLLFAIYNEIGRDLTTKLSENVFFCFYIAFGRFVNMELR